MTVKNIGSTDHHLNKSSLLVNYRISISNRYWPIPFTKTDIAPSSVELQKWDLYQKMLHEMELIPSLAYLRYFV